MSRTFLSGRFSASTFSAKATPAAARSPSTSSSTRPRRCASSPPIGSPPTIICSAFGTPTTRGGRRGPPVAREAPRGAPAGRRAVHGGHHGLRARLDQAEALVEPRLLRRLAEL